MLATIVDTKALFEVVLASFVAVTGVTVAFSLSIVGATRFGEMRHDSRPLEAAAYGLMAFVGIAVSLAALVFGIVVMISK